MNFLKVHVNPYFEEEEQLMKQSNYPHHATHKAQHAEFIEMLNDFKRDYQQEENP